MPVTQTVGGEMSVLVPRVDPALVPGTMDRLRVPTIQLATKAPVFLVGPGDIPSPGLIFRDSPEFAPAPAMREEHLTRWPSFEPLQTRLMCSWHYLVTQTPTTPKALSRANTYF